MPDQGSLKLARERPGGGAAACSSRDLETKSLCGGASGGGRPTKGADQAELGRIGGAEVDLGLLAFGGKKYGA